MIKDCIGYKEIKNNNIRMITLFVGICIFLTPIEFIPIIPGASLNKFIAIIPIFFLVFYLNDIHIKNDKMFLIPFIYLIYVMCSLIYSVDYNVTLQRVISVGLNIIFILFINVIRYSKKELKFLEKSLLYSGWFTLLIIILYGNKTLMGGRLTLEVNGAYQDPNYLVGFFLFNIVYYYDDFMMNKRKISIVKILPFIIVGLLSGSRGGVITIFFSIVIYTIYFLKKQKFEIINIIVIILGIFIICIAIKEIAFFLPSDILNRYNIDYTLRDNGAQRFNIWKSILYNYRNFSDIQKLFGRGAGTIRYFTFNGNVGHNIWIESLCEIGIIGSFLLALFYFIYIREACKFSQLKLFVTFIGYIIMTMSLSLYSYKPIWNVILLILVYRNGEYVEAKENL